MLVVGGELGMGGAGLLCSEAALKVGAGLVSLATALNTSAQARCGGRKLWPKRTHGGGFKRPTTLKRRCWPKGLAPGTLGPVLYQAALGSGKPVVLTLTGLNLLAKATAGLSCPRPRIITPHPAEAARLLGTTTEQIQADRTAAALALAAKTQAVVVLKRRRHGDCGGRRVLYRFSGQPGSRHSRQRRCALRPDCRSLGAGLIRFRGCSVGRVATARLADALVAGKGHFGHSAGI